MSTHPRHRIAIALPALFSALLLGVNGLRQAYLDIVFTAADTELSFWASESYRPEVRTIERTGSSLETLLRHSPNHPDYLSEQAYFLSWKGYFSSDLAQRLAFNEQAVAIQYAALQLRPAHRQGWFKMVEYASRTTGGGPMLSEARARIEALQPVLL
jgi:hypothetical protein